MLGRINFFGVDFVKASYDELMDEFFRVLIKPLKKPKLVFTPNNEILVEAERSPEFLKVLQEADYALPDSTGVYFAAKVLAWPGIKTRLTGVDITEKFLEENQKYKVFLLGGEKGAAEVMANRYKQVVDFYDGKVLEENTVDILKQIKESKAEVLFAALGAPKQEKWLLENKKNLKGVKLAFGVGGTLDFLAGIQKRAPRLLRWIGMEWLWRLFKEPARIKRIYRATFVFVFLTVKKVLGF